jgi:hypothetical protein
MNLQNENLTKYLNHGFNTVEGWCEPELFITIDSIDALPINKTGGVCEIGVHHGKLFLLMNQITDPAYKSYAIDVFGNQELNIDKSGEGNLDTFRRNLINFDAHAGRNTIIVQGDSTDPALELTKLIKPGSLRFMSIDGGHTAIHALNDLKLAETLINNQGIVILDDVLNHWWPGVLEGLVTYLQDKPTLVPVAVGHNKLYLAKVSYKDYYLNHFKNLDFGGPKEVRKFFGHEISINRYWPRYMGY